jgi:hypothetical protein
MTTWAILCQGVCMTLPWAQWTTMPGRSPQPKQQRVLPVMQPICVGQQLAACVQTRCGGSSHASHRAWLHQLSYSLCCSCSSSSSSSRALQATELQLKPYTCGWLGCVVQVHHVWPQLQHVPWPLWSHRAASRGLQPTGFQVSPTPTVPGTLRLGGMQQQQWRQQQQD